MPELIPKIVTLLSVAHHPLSGREIYSTNDGRALQLALQLNAPRHKAVHVGDKGCPALEGYLGMGLDKIYCLDGGKDNKKYDVCSLLSSFIQQENPALVICGTRAQGGMASGMLPYILARELQLPLISGILHASRQDDKIKLVQFLPRGKRRDLTADLPLILVVHPNAPLDIMFAWARAQAGSVLASETTQQEISQLCGDWEYSELRKGRKRLAISSGKSGFERMQRALSMQGGGGQIIKDGSSADKAKIAFDFLRGKNLV